MQEKLRQDGLEAPPTDDRVLTPAEERALQAEKRAAWRAARCGLSIYAYHILIIV